MSPSLNSRIVSMQEVPFDDVQDLRSPATQPDGSRPIVLVVDDEPLVANTLAVILARSGYAARVAYDGPGALKLAAEIKPALLISDVAMPGMTGIELAMRLMEVQPDCKVLLFSGNASEFDLAPAVEAGYDFPLLAKPVPPVSMLQAVTRCLAADTPRASMNLPRSAAEQMQTAA